MQQGLFEGAVTISLVVAGERPLVHAVHVRSLLLGAKRDLRPQSAGSLFKDHRANP